MEHDSLIKSFPFVRLPAGCEEARSRRWGRDVRGVGRVASSVLGCDGPPARSGIDRAETAARSITDPSLGNWSFKDRSVFNLIFNLLIGGSSGCWWRWWCACRPVGVVRGGCWGCRVVGRGRGGQDRVHGEVLPIWGSSFPCTLPPSEVGCRRGTGGRALFRQPLPELCVT